MRTSDLGVNTYLCHIVERQHVYDVECPPTRCGAGQLRPAWTTLLGALDRALLSTHRSKFTQFLLWFVAQQARRQRRMLPLCSWSPACCEATCQLILLESPAVLCAAM